MFLIGQTSAIFKYSFQRGSWDVHRRVTFQFTCLAFSFSESHITCLVICTYADDGCTTKQLIPHGLLLRPDISESVPFLFSPWRSLYVHSVWPGILNLQPRSFFEQSNWLSLDKEFPDFSYWYRSLVFMCNEAGAIFFLLWWCEWTSKRKGVTIRDWMLADKTMSICSHLLKLSGYKYVFVFDILCLNVGLRITLLFSGEFSIYYLHWRQFT